MGARFQVLFHSLPGAFHFPYGTGALSVTVVVLRLGWWSTQFGPGFTCPALLRDASRRPVWVRVRAVPLRRPLPCRSLPSRTCARGRQPPDARPCNPVGGTPAGYARSTVWPSVPFARRYSGSLEIDFLSSGYLDVSVPRVVLPPLCVRVGICTLLCMGSPIRRPRVEGCVLLAGDYRSLPRPSSAPCAKASACAVVFAGPHRARGYPRVAKLINDIMIALVCAIRVSHTAAQSVSLCSRSDAPHS